MAGGKQPQRGVRGDPTGRPPHPRSAPSLRAERRAVGALRLMRQGKSLTAAARAVGSDPRTVRKYVGKALRHREGIYHPIPVDRMRRPMRVLTPAGLLVVDVWSSRTASRLAKYWGAVDHYLRTGDRRRLAPFAGKRFRAQGQVIAFVTDSRLLEQLANAGEVRFEDLYDKAV